MVMPYGNGGMPINPMLLQLLLGNQSGMQSQSQPAPTGPVIPQVQRPMTGGNGIPPITAPPPQPPAPAAQPQGGLPPGLLQMLLNSNRNPAGANMPANTPSNNYYYGLTQGQGNPAMYGGGGGNWGILNGLLGNNQSYAGMGWPT